LEGVVPVTVVETADPKQALKTAVVRRETKSPRITQPPEKRVI
jgi:hypothetical protein